MSNLGGHKIWEKLGGISGVKFLLWGLFSILGVTVMVAAFLWGNAWENRDWVQPEGVYFVEADAYARMTRVAILADVAPWAGRPERESWPFLHWHGFENAPEGIRPHTTAALDWAILALAWFLAVGKGASAGAPAGALEVSLEWAGWWIGPLLGAVFLVVAWWWSGSWVGRVGQRGVLPYRWAMLGLLAGSPMLWHAWSFGRPDHQGLTLLLIGGGWMAEAVRWREGGGTSVGGGIFTGFLWAAAFWVSWFEPLILFAVGGVLAGVRCWREPARWRGEVWKWGTALVGALAVAYLEGPPRLGLAPEWGEVFARWAGEIGELQGVRVWDALPGWIGWAGLAVPFLLGWRMWRHRKDTASCWECWLCGWWLIWWGVLAVLTVWHVRWGYFLVVASVLALPWAWGWWRPRWLAAGVFVVSLWPWAAALERSLESESDGRGEQQEAMRVAELRALREVALFLREEEGTGSVLAPWWLTPPLVYWSGRDGVGGSSHQSLPGIVQSAEFFLAGAEGERAGARLREGGVRFVVVGDAKQVQKNSAAILGREFSELRESGALLGEGFDPGLGWELLGRNAFFTVWRLREER